MLSTFIAFATISVFVVVSTVGVVFAPVALAIPDIADSSSACRIAVRADPMNRIMSWRFYGPNNTCTGMMQRLV